MRAYDKYIEYKKIVDLILLFFIISIITFFVKHYFTALVIIVIILIIDKPIYNIVKKMHLDNRIAGALSILIFNISIFLFIFYFGNSIYKNIIYFYKNHYNDLNKIILSINTIIGVDLNSLFTKGISMISSSTVKNGVSLTGASILSYVIANITAYFLLIDEKFFNSILLRLLPIKMLNKIEDKKSNLKEVVKVELKLVLICTLIITIGFKILKIPSSIFLGIICGLLDILPYVGTIIVFVPIIIYNIVIKNYIIVVGLIALYILSQVIRELLELKFLSSKLDIHPLVVMLSIYIGAEIYGVLGMITGPIFCIIAKDIIYD